MPRTIVANLAQQELNLEQRILNIDKSRPRPRLETARNYWVNNHERKVILQDVLQSFAFNLTTPS